jgi:hypothetical protein
MRVLRFKLPKKYSNTRIGADLEMIELYFDDGQGDLMQLAGI